MTAISIIIPVYNAQKYLAKCIDSILEQNFDDIEVICVNDGSTDDSLEILKYYATRNSKIKFITQINQNAGIARNAGLEIATGQYIFFMDADDLLYENSVLKNLYNITKITDAPIIKFKAKAFDDITEKYCFNKLYEGYKISETSWNRFLSLEKDIDEIVKLSVVPWVGLYKRDFLLRSGIRFNANKCCNDRSFNALTIIEAGGVYLSNLVAINHRKSNTSLITIRDKNFNCHFTSFNIVRDFLKSTSYSEVTKRKLLLKELLDIYCFYNKFSKNSSHFASIYRGLMRFSKTLNLNTLRPEIENENIYYILQRMQTSNILLAPITYYSKQLYNKFFYKSVAKFLFFIFLYQNRTKKIAFWGGSLYLTEFLRKHPWITKYKNIIGIIDKDETKSGTDIYGLKIYPPNSIEKLEPEVLLLTIENKSRFIYNELREQLKTTPRNIKLGVNIFETEFIELCQK